MNPVARIEHGETAPRYGRPQAIAYRKGWEAALRGADFAVPYSRHGWGRSLGGAWENGYKAALRKARR